MTDTPDDDLAREFFGVTTPAGGRNLPPAPEAPTGTTDPAQASPDPAADPDLDHAGREFFGLNEAQNGLWRQINWPAR